jgi:hypothetical protein
MQVLKMVFGLLLMFSLVLPLSTCSGVVEEGSRTQAERTARYIVTKDSPVSEWLWAFGFVIPFGISAAKRNRKASIKSEVICLLSIAPASYVIWLHSATGKLTSGGIIALSSIIFFVLVTVICITQVSTEKNKAPAAPPL